MRLFVIHLFVFLIVPFFVFGQPSLFDALHTNGDTILFRVDADWKEIVRKKKDKTYRPVHISMVAGDSTLAFRGKIRSRGNIRLEVCQNPSLKIKLKKDALLNAGFSELNELKFVLQCSNSVMGESYLRRERLVYDLHAVFSDYSHRTIPVSLDFGDGDICQAFMIEHAEQLGKRYNARVHDSGRLSTRGLARKAYVNMCLFNYLILNTDWHVFNAHNVKFIKPQQETRIIPIPYDFDYSGFVGTHYAIPREELDISSIYIPKWLGKNITPAEIKAGAEHYLARRAIAEKLISDYPSLGKRDRKRMLKRLEAFYKLLEDERKLRKLIQ